MVFWVGADAQPDGTVGRRRFWRGSFLFHPDTDSGAAGFKAYRPSVYDRDTKVLTRASNRKLRKLRRRPFSTQQYKGTTDEFYDAMAAIINPRPLDPLSVQKTLVDALQETVLRRANSVANGEAFMSRRDFSPIDMPEGSKIFLTTGPWEDFSTPSRDWRLLISIDTVWGFPARVQRAPKQFGLKPGSTETTRMVQGLRDKLKQALRAKKFTYQRSDGTPQQLSLLDVVERQKEFEMAYNPNDCIEVRWGAALQSSEMETCTRRAPQEQQRRMEDHREWFRSRRRPAN